MCSAEVEPESSAATDDENELDLSATKLPSILVDGDDSAVAAARGMRSRSSMLSRAMDKGFILNRR